MKSNGTSEIRQQYCRKQICIQTGQINHRIDLWRKGEVLSNTKLFVFLYIHDTQQCLGHHIKVRVNAEITNLDH